VSGSNQLQNAHRRILVVFCHLFLILGFVLIPSLDANAKNYIENGDFETLGIDEEEVDLEGWGWPDTPPYSVTLNSSQQYSGEQSMRIGGITSAPSIELVWYPADENGDPVYRIFPICTRNDAPPPNGTPYKSMEVKFGGFIGSIISASGAKIDINLEIRDDDTWSEVFTASDIYDFSKGGWQHFAKRAWFDLDGKTSPFEYQLTINIAGANNNSIYLDDFYILPNFVEDGNFERFTVPDYPLSEYFLTNEAYGDHQLVDIANNNCLLLEVPREITTSILTFGKSIISYKPDIIYAPVEYNRCFDFSYRLKLFENAPPREEIKQSAVSATIWCKDLSGKIDRTSTGTPFNNYITEGGTGKEWDTYSASIHNPAEFDSDGNRIINFCFNHRCVNEIDEDPNDEYIYGLDDIWLCEKVPHFPEISASSIMARIFPAAMTEDESSNGYYPGKISEKYVNVEITWKTDVPSCGGWVNFSYSTPPPEPLDVPEDNDFIPKLNHRVRTKLDIENKNLDDYSFIIYSPGMERGWTISDSYDLGEIPNYQVSPITKNLHLESPLTTHPDFDLPVLCGVPILKETLNDESYFHMQKSSDSGQNWENIACQTKILSHWFDHFHGSENHRPFSRGIKWLLTSFIETAGSDVDYRVLYADQNQREPVYNNFLIKHEFGYFYVTNNGNPSETATIKFKVWDHSETGKEHEVLFDLLYYVDDDDQTILTGEGIRTAIELENDNPNYELQHGKFESVEVIYNGELCGIIELTMKSTHTFIVDEVEVDEILYTPIRMTVFKNQPYVLFDYGILNNAGSVDISDGSVTIEKMYLEMNLDTEDASSSSFKYVFGADETYTGSLASGGDHSLLQDGAVTLSGSASNCVGETYQFTWSDGDALTGGKAYGWLGIYDEDTVSPLPYQVFAGIPNFWQQFPAKLRVKREAITGDETEFFLEFVPSGEEDEIDAVLPYSSRISYQNVFLFFAGQGDTKPAFDSDHLAIFENPPYIRFNESYYEETGVYGPLIPETDFPSAGEMDKLFEYYQDNFVKAENAQEDPIGILTVGYTNPSETSPDYYNKKGFSKEYWGEYRITDKRDHIVSNEYEIGGVFSRLGSILEEGTTSPPSQRDRYFRAAFREGKYLLDRVFHWTPYEDVRQYNLESRLPRGIPHHHWTGVHVRGYDSGHCQGIPILDWYYSNTGDPDALDMLTSFADAICLSEAEKFQSIDQYQLGGLERHLGWPLYSLVQAYNSTGDPYYILNAETLMDRAGSFLIDVKCPDESVQKCYGRLLKEIDNGKFRYVALGGQTFTTAILNHAVAKYSETTGDDSADYQLGKISEFLECLHHDVSEFPQIKRYLFYKDSHGESNGAQLDLLLASPGILYTGNKIADLELEEFGRELIGDFNNWEDYPAPYGDQRPKPSAELKQHGQMTNFVLDFMGYYKE